MDLDPKTRAFLEKNHGAAMVTLREDGSAHAVRVGLALVGGKLWSSGTRVRARTEHLRRDPRATLFVFEPGFGYVTLEAKVKILDGPDVPEQSLALFRTMQAGMTPPSTAGHLYWNGVEVTPGEFRQAMVDEGRIIYEFEPLRSYGLH
jgi:PPOX class probable F420-dependent enzyme